MDLNFRDSPRKKKYFKYLSFLPKQLRQIGLYALLINLTTLLLAIVFYPSMQKEIPLFYSLPSNQQLVTKNALFILVILASFINLLHFSIIKSFKNANQTILRVFMLITNILQVLILAILCRLISILN